MRKRIFDENQSNETNKKRKILNEHPDSSHNNISQSDNELNVSPSCDTVPSALKISISLDLITQTQAVRCGVGGTTNKLNR